MVWQLNNRLYNEFEFIVVFFLHALDKADFSLRSRGCKHSDVTDAFAVEGGEKLFVWVCEADKYVGFGMSLNVNMAASLLMYVHKGTPIISAQI